MEHRPARALRMQLSPHTLFNLLHTIRGYIEWDRKERSPCGATRRLLRRLLSAGERDFSRLADELQYVSSTWSCSSGASPTG